MKKIPSRRIFIRTFYKGAFLFGGALLAGGALLTGGCRRGGSSGDGEQEGDRGEGASDGKPADGRTDGKPADGKPADGKPAADPCEDYSQLSSEDLQTREKLGYQKESPMPDRQCGNCNLFLPPKGDEKCGGCTLFRGPVYAAAYCTYWAPQV